MIYSGFISGPGGMFVLKAPGDAESYTLSWGDWLSGGALDSSVWANDAGVAISSPVVSGEQTSIVVSGGASGGVYTITNTVISGFRAKTVSFKVRVVSEIDYTTDTVLAEAYDRINIDQIAQMVSADVSGCPKPAIRKAINQAARDFFEQSKKWQADLSLGVYSVATKGYPITLPGDAELSVIMYGVIGARQAPQQCFGTLNGTVATIRGISGADGDPVSVRAALIPTYDAQQLPACAQSYLAELSDGAKGVLMLQPNKPWSDPQLGVELASRARTAANAARIDTALSGAHGVMAVQIPGTFAAPRRGGGRSVW